MNPLRPDFAGVYLVIAVAVAGAVIARRRRDRAAPIAIGYAYTCQIAGIAMGVVWFSQTDWMYHHYQGPSILLFTSMATMVLGIVAFFAASGLAVIDRIKGATRGFRIGMALRWLTLALLTVLSGFAVLILKSEIARLLHWSVE